MELAKSDMSEKSFKALARDNLTLPNASTLSISNGKKCLAFAESITGDAESLPRIAIRDMNGEKETPLDLKPVPDFLKQKQKWKITGMSFDFSGRILVP